MSDNPIYDTILANKDALEARMSEAFPGLKIVEVTPKNRTYTDETGQKQSVISASVVLADKVEMDNAVYVTMEVDAESIYVDSVFVDEQYEGKGLTRSLMQSVAKFAEEIDVKQITLVPVDGFVHIAPRLGFVASEDDWAKQIWPNIKDNLFKIQYDFETTPEDEIELQRMKTLLGDAPGPEALAQISESSLADRILEDVYIIGEDVDDPRHSTLRLNLDDPASAERLNRASNIDLTIRKAALEEIARKAASGIDTPLAESNATWIVDKIDYRTNYLFKDVDDAKIEDYVNRVEREQAYEEKLRNQPVPELTEERLTELLGPADIRNEQKVKFYQQVRQKMLEDLERDFAATRQESEIAGDSVEATVAPLDATRNSGESEATLTAREMAGQRLTQGPQKGHSIIITPQTLLERAQRGGGNFHKR